MRTRITGRRPCVNCKQSVLITRKGRCGTCSSYYRRCGEERPDALARLLELRRSTTYRVVRDAENKEYAEIPLLLGNGELDTWTAIDIEDLDLAELLWRRGIYGYAVRTVSKPRRTTVQLHHFVFARVVPEIPRGYVIDHRDGLLLNNRRGNLRLATYSQNNQNRVPNKSGKAHGARFKGVSWNESWQKWMAYIAIDRKTKNLGGYASEIEAASAYDDAARRLFGEFARLNAMMFPEHAPELARLSAHKGVCTGGGM